MRVAFVKAFEGWSRAAGCGLGGLLAGRGCGGCGGAWVRFLGCAARGFSGIGAEEAAQSCEAEDLGGGEAGFARGDLGRIGGHGGDEDFKGLEGGSGEAVEESGGWGDGGGDHTLSPFGENIPDKCWFVKGKFGEILDFLSG